jgi:hypothetical protein
MHSKEQYNNKAVGAIVVKLSSTIEDHARKQVQMHAVAWHLVKKFTSKVPSAFGDCFSCMMVMLNMNSIASTKSYN